MQALRDAKLEEIQGIAGIGPIVGKAVHDYVHDEEYSALIDALAAVGVRMDDERAAAGGPLSGETVVVTGSLERWSRDRVEGLVRQLGGKVGSSVTKATSFVVAGEGGGSKRARAEALGRPILDEEQFVAHLRARGWEGE
jgi:DNA ligase (NAD+)